MNHNSIATTDIVSQYQYKLRKPKYVLLSEEKIAVPGQRTENRIKYWKIENRILGLVSIWDRERKTLKLH